MNQSGRLTITALGIIACVIWASCGGGGASQPPPVSGTPAGTYTISITAVGNSVSHTANASLVVK
jgi:hypothetical protein